MKQDSKLCNIFLQIKDMPNPSKGLLKFFKRNPYKRIWGYFDVWDKKKVVTLKKTRESPLRSLRLKVGYPFQYNGKTHFKSRGFNGQGLRQHMFTGRKCGDVCLVGIGPKNTKGLWMIDVTEKVIKELQEVGSCALSKAHCKFELISPRVKQCKFCGRKIKKRIQVIRRVTWEK